VPIQMPMIGIYDFHGGERKCTHAKEWSNTRAAMSGADGTYTPNLVLWNTMVFYLNHSFDGYPSEVWE